MDSQPASQPAAQPLGEQQQTLSKLYREQSVCYNCNTCVTWSLFFSAFSPNGVFLPSLAFWGRLNFEKIKIKLNIFLNFIIFYIKIIFKK